MRTIGLLLYLLTAVGEIEGADYQLHFSPDEPKVVRIVARLYLDRPELTMVNSGIPADVPNGWATFVSISSIRLVSGEEIGFKEGQTKSTWRLDMDPGNEIVIDYLVRLDYHQYDWTSVGGQDARPSLLPGPSIFWITKGLFVIPYAANLDVTASDAISVEFQIPVDWRVSTAWIEESAKTHTFNVKNYLSLVNNALMVGKHMEKKIRFQEMTITWAVAANLAHRTALFSNTLESVLPVFRSLFGELPQTNYLICATRNGFEDGEAFTNSFHQMFIDSDLEHRKIVWANVLAHEMFHYWNGTYFLRGLDVQGHYWFSEGFTEYYSNLALIRAGIISESEYFQKLSFQFSRYFNSRILKPTPHPNLVEAGYQKNQNWSLIYGGGATTAFVLDVKIRSESNGQHSLDDVIRYLYQEQGKSFMMITQEHLLGALKTVTGNDYFDFFQNYINGLKLLPLLEACEQAGLSVAYYQGEFYLERQQESGRIIESIIGDSVAAAGLHMNE